jgi:hypothetical protein
MSNLTDAAHRRLAERQAAYAAPKHGETTKPGSLNPHKSGAPAGRRLRVKGANATASRKAAGKYA